jgi:hypothetical protein
MNGRTDGRDGTDGTDGRTDAWVEIEWAKAEPSSGKAESRERADIRAAP